MAARVVACFGLLIAALAPCGCRGRSTAGSGDPTRGVPGPGPAPPPTEQVEPRGSVLDRTRPGMPEEECDALLRSEALAVAYTWQTGSGSQTRVYHLPEDRQAIVEYALLGTEQSVGGESTIVYRSVVDDVSIGPKTAWHGVVFDLSEAERSRAIEVARRAVDDLATRGDDPAKAFPTDPAGMLVLPRREVAIRDVTGASSGYDASAWGEWLTHRIAYVDILQGDAWRWHVAIDLDEDEVVPTSWAPSEADLRAAKDIAAPDVRDFIQGEAEVRVRAWGEFDYGPTRRLVTLLYEKPSGLGSSLRFVTVDLDGKRLWRHPLWEAGTARSQDPER